MLKDEFKFSDSVVKIAIEKIGINREWNIFYFTYFIGIYWKNYENF